MSHPLPPRPLPPKPDTARSLPDLPVAASSSSSSADRKLRSSRGLTRLEPVLEGDDRLLRDIQKPPPGDVRDLKRRVSSPAIARQRSRYFEEAFPTSKEMGSQATSEEAIRSKTMVLVEIKTNIYVNDEAKFLRELSQHIARRYHRSTASIAVTLQHGACVFLGGSFEPAYVASVHALPEHVQTATNKRNAALIQKHLEVALGVPSPRGIVRFVGVPEECWASAGRTVAGELASAAAATTSSSVSQVQKDGRRDSPSKEDGPQRRRTLRTLSRLRSGSSGISPAPPMGPSASTSGQNTGDEEAHAVNNERASLASPTQRSASAASARDASPAPPTLPPKGRVLGHKKSLTFMQTLFGKTRSIPTASSPNKSRQGTSRVD